MPRLLALLLLLAAAPAAAGAQGVPVPGDAAPAIRQVDTGPPQSREAGRDPAFQVAPAAPADASAEAFAGALVTRIAVSGADADAVPADELAAVTAPFTGHRLGVEDLRDLLTAVSGVARGHGYIFARASIPAQSMAQGVLQLTLDLGRIDQVRLIGDDNGAVQAILDRLCGKAPLRSEIERRILLARDLPGVSIGNPSFEREQGRGVLIVPVRYDRVAGRAFADNRGSRDGGRVRAQLAFDFNGLLDDRDQLSVSVFGTPGSPRRLRVLWGRYARQLGADGTEIAVFGAIGGDRPGGAWEAFNANGQSLSVGLSVSRPLWRRRSASLWLTGEFAHVAVDRWFAGNQVRRDRVTTLALSLNGTAPLAGGRLRAGAGITQGLDVLGATAPGDVLASRPGADGEFTMFSAWSNWEGGLAGPFSARLAVTAQLATQPLLAVQQLAIGGPVFGRAYEFGEVSGDRGILASAEVQAKVWDRRQGLLNWAQLYGFADAGSVTNLRNSFGTGQRLSLGMGARARIANALRLGVEAAFPVNADRYDSGDRSPRLSASASASF